MYSTLLGSTHILLAFEVNFGGGFGYFIFFFFGLSLGIGQLIVYAGGSEAISCVAWS